MSEAAEKLLEKIKSGESFSTLAEKYSLDKESAESGGQWKGWVIDGEDSLGIGYVNEVARAIFSLKKGEISGPVKIGNYFYIFRMDDYKPGRDRDFEEVREQVERDYYAGKLKKAYQALLDQVLKTEEVKLYPEVIVKSEKES